MWPPTTQDDIEQAIDSGILQERTRVEFKRELPATPTKNVDVAVDVCAMTVSGGTIVYGIAEGAGGRPVSRPITLKGERDRVANIVRSSISEPPELEITEVRLKTDAAVGYLVVHVPPSPLAPHMVEVKGHSRYYGRNEAGNYPLPHSEVLALIERRRRLERSWKDALEEAVSLSPDLSDSDDFVPMHVLILPLLTDRGIFERAFPEGVNGLRNELASLERSLPFREDGGHSLTTVARYDMRVEDGWLFFVEPEAKPMPYYNRRLEFGDSGEVSYFWGGVASTRADTHDAKPVQQAADHAIAQAVTQVALLAGRAYERAGYRGQVDAAVAIRNAAKTVSGRSWFEFPMLRRPFAKNNFERGGRFQGSQLVNNPSDVALQLVGPWLRRIRQDDPSLLLKLKSK